MTDFYDEPLVPGHATEVHQDSESGRYVATCECGWTFDPNGIRWSPTIKAWEHRKAIADAPQVAERMAARSRYPSQGLMQVIPAWRNKVD